MLADFCLFSLFFIFVLWVIGAILAGVFGGQS